MSERTDRILEIDRDTKTTGKIHGEVIDEALKWDKILPDNFWPYKTKTGGITFETQDGVDVEILSPWDCEPSVHISGLSSDMLKLFRQG